MFLKRVVITGIGTINPLGNNVKEFSLNLDKGISGATLIDRFDTSLFKTKFACEVPGYMPVNFGFDRKEERKIDRFTQFALISTAEAVENANIDLEKCDMRRIGVIIGSGIGGLESVNSEIMDYVEGQPPRFSPFLIPKIIINMAAGEISMKYGFRGPNFATSSACATSSHAICVACGIIELGKADIMVAGGSEAPIIVPAVGGFNSSHALSTNNEEYKTASRPFDKTRDGFVMGEGAGTLILEEYEHAVNRGAKIYAEIIGCGMTADAYHITAPHPEGLGAQEAMIAALEDANIAPKDVDYINVHGTSTPIGDVIELKAVQEVFKESAYNLNISSTKSMTGHLLGAAGVVESIACIHAIDSGIVPPTINHKVADEDIDAKLNLTLNEAQSRDVNIAMSNNFGFGGQNSCLIFKKVK
ncbi:MAG: beta-ketoacyl-ACP synthase II [Bacteroidales bacterium]|nr:beta-ketoacyl-ACP synthase II [Bacteroidales bacterium]MDD3200857.1 beta-ketoacyl-ACP synthase II [Bacteroidales bacterium]